MDWDDQGEKQKHNSGLDRRRLSFRSNPGGQQPFSGNEVALRRPLGAGLHLGAEGRGVAGVHSGPFVVFSEDKGAGSLLGPPNKPNVPDQGWESGVEQNVLGSN